MIRYIGSNCVDNCLGERNHLRITFLKMRMHIAMVMLMRIYPSGEIQQDKYDDRLHCDKM